MRFKNFVSGYLTEGGKALKTASPMTQAEAKSVSKAATAKLAEVLKIDPKLIRPVGSAGNKPKPDDMSNDVDLVVKCSRDELRDKLKDLAFDGKSFKELKGLNVYSFGLGSAGRHHQVDVIPVNNLDMAEWAYQAHPDDLKAGLKGTHRNELFFAAVKHLPEKVLETDAKGEATLKERFYYDLGHGLFSGKAERKGKRGTKKNWSAGKDKQLVTDDPDKISQQLFGTSAINASTFEGTLNAILNKKFPNLERRQDVLKTAADGIKKKGLDVPSSLSKALNPK